MSDQSPTKQTRIYHNPRCSKSRATLSLLEQQGINPEIIRYLDTPPSASELSGLTKMLDTSIHTIVRRGETEFKALGEDADKLSENEMIDAVCNAPILLERPIVVHNNQAAIGRPPENILSLFKK